MSFLKPLSAPEYRKLWTVAFFSNFGIWMHNTAVASALVTVTSDPVVNALLPVATLLPVFLFAIPAGVFGDRFDRGFLLFWSNLGSAVISSLFWVTHKSGVLGPVVMLALTFGLNAFWAITYPAWNAKISSAVPRELVKDAASLNNLSFNLARTCGPALGGSLFALLGGDVVFLLSPLSFVGFVVLFWPLKSRPQARNSRPLSSAVKEMAALVTGDGFFRAILVRTCAYFFFAQFVWALLPLWIVKLRGWSSAELGFLTGAAGIGAILCAVSQHGLRRKFSEQGLLNFSIAGTALCLAVLPWIPYRLVVALPLLLFGASYSLAIATQNGLIQANIETGLRARAIGLYVVVLYGIQALGAFAAGVLTERVGLSQVGAVAAAALLVVGGLVAAGCPLREPEAQMASTR